ncbi:MAG: Gfo/Idh/MocA family oxidoreductase, partial [Deltaproteobacteria bacterium]
MKKIALLGAAHIHTPDFVRRLLARKDFNVVGVWDHDSERANLNAQKFGCQICSSVDELLQLDALDAVIVCAETNRHEQILAKVAQAGKHCFVEKPLGMGKADSERMNKA